MKYWLIALLFFVSSVQAGTLSGRVVGVSDGDTITILDNTNTQFKIRLSGIDAPEKKQPFGQVSVKRRVKLSTNQRPIVSTFLSC